MRKRESKEFRSGVAAVIAIAVLATGTFAWQSFNQAVTNETSGDPLNPGGRLHDDFDGSNKDIYVENYTGGLYDDLEGSPLFVRVKLDEYMEYGEYAGYLTDVTKNINREDFIEGLTILRGDRKEEVIVTEVEQGDWNSALGDYDEIITETVTYPEPVIDNYATWDTYLFGSKAETGIETIRTYQDMVFGNVINPNRGATDYMPTFNKNNESLESDINGTLEGVDLDRYEGEAYDDFILYNTDGSNDGVTSKTANAEYYDENAANKVKYESEIHYTQSTLQGSVISMEAWHTMGSPEGAYWVYDTDGWAYWAQPLEEQSATALLLDAIKTELEPIENWYYSINVVAQIATKGDWGDATTYDNEGEVYSEATGMLADITSNGLDLLNQIAGVVVGQQPSQDNVEAPEVE